MRRERAVVGIFPSAWEADIARRYLEDAGIPAWLDDDAAGEQVTQLEAPAAVVLYVSPDDEDDARAILQHVDPLEDDDLAAARASFGRRPLWVAAVALLVVVGMVITAVPQVLWVPLLALAILGLVLWQLVRPAPPGGR